MSTTEVQAGNARSDTKVRTVDMKLEVVEIPVSDEERAARFYASIGWRQDVTPPGSGVYQFTPPGSGCSIQWGKGRTNAAPGSARGLWLIVADLQAAVDRLASAGVKMDEVFHFGARGKEPGRDFLIDIDRASAVRHLIDRARPGDTVLLAGKGHERRMLVGAARLPWNDREEAERALRAVQNERCQPYKLPPEKFARWQHMTVEFAPTDD